MIRLYDEWRLFKLMERRRRGKSEFQGLGNQRDDDIVTRRHGKGANGSDAFESNKNGNDSGGERWKESVNVLDVVQVQASNDKSISIMIETNTKFSVPPSGENLTVIRVQEDCRRLSTADYVG
jgi:hypothetical protein